MPFRYGVMLGGPRRTLVFAGVSLVFALLSVRSPIAAGQEVQLQLAELLFAEARYREAIDIYDELKISKERPVRVQAGRRLVQAYLRLAEFNKAREEAIWLKSEAPRDAEVVALEGDTLWAAGLFDEAEQTFRAALALNAECARGRHGLARTLAARNQLEQALGEAQAAMRIAPRDGEFHHTVGAVYERMHRFEEAAVAFTNYLNLLPNKDRSEKAAWSRAEIRFLKSFGQRVPFQIEQTGDTVLHTVPFKLVRDKVVVNGSVNGGPPMDFVLDTGSEQTVISRRTAQRMGVTPIVYTLSAGVGEIGLRGLQVGRLDSLQVGTLKINNVPCLIKSPPLKDMPTREGESFSPLALGLSMTIDYQRRMLTIGQQGPVEPGELELPLRLHRLAMVRGTVNNNYPASFVVDTGGEVISISAATAGDLPPRQGRRIPLKVYGTSGWDRTAFLMPGVDLAFETIRFPNFPVVVLDLEAPSALLGFRVGGIVGHRFLSKYRVGIDLERSTLRLKELGT